MNCFKNALIVSPTLIALCCPLALLSHRAAGIAALTCAVAAPFVAMLPATTRLIDGHKRIAYSAATIAWCFSLAHVIRFWLRVMS